MQRNAHLLETPPESGQNAKWQGHGSIDKRQNAPRQTKLRTLELLFDSSTIPRYRRKHTGKSCQKWCNFACLKYYEPDGSDIITLHNRR